MPTKVDDPITKDVGIGKCSTGFRTDNVLEFANLYSKHYIKAKFEVII